MTACQGRSGNTSDCTETTLKDSASIPSIPEQLSHKAVSLIHQSIGGFFSSIGKAYELTLQLQPLQHKYNTSHFSATLQGTDCGTTSLIPLCFSCTRKSWHASRGVAGKLPDGKGPWCTVGQSAEYEPAVCPGGQEGQWHPGLYQEWCGEQD